MYHGNGFTVFGLNRHGKFVNYIFALEEFGMNFSGKGCLVAGLGGMLILASFVIGGVVTAITSGATGLFVGAAIFIYGIVLLFKGDTIQVKNNLGITDFTPVSRANIQKWENVVSHLPYRYSWQGFGIALDPYNKLLFLKGYFYDYPYEKMYAFSDVREWYYSCYRHAKMTLS